MVQTFGFEEPLFVISITFLALGWTACLLRAWVKIVVIKKVTLDDYLMLCGIIFYSAYSASGLYGITHGLETLGKSGDASVAEKASAGLRAWWMCEMLYPPVTLSVRTSVAVFLLQIAVQRVHRRIILGVIVVFWLVTIPLFFVIVFQCRPVAYFWLQPYPDTPRGTCIDNRAIYAVTVAHSIISACSDWVLGILPLVMLWKVRLNKKTKVTLSLLLGMGIFAGIALIVRVIYTRPFQVSASFLHESMNVGAWSILEPSLCIIAGCMATLRPLFNRLGWVTITRSSRPSPGRYRRAWSTSRSWGSRGIGHVFAPGFWSLPKSASPPSRRAQGGGGQSAKSAANDGPRNEYELTGQAEKRESVAMGTADEKEKNREHRADRRSVSRAATDGEADRKADRKADRRVDRTADRRVDRTADRGADKEAKAEGRRADRRSACRREADGEAHVGVRAAPPALALDQPPPQSFYFLPAWHDLPSQQPLGPLFSTSPSSSSPLSFYPPSPASPTTMRPPAVLTPSPCHIVVKKSTRVEYKDTPASAATMPAIPADAMVPEMPERGATMGEITAAGRPSEDHVLLSGHTVEISGPRTKRLRDAGQTEERKK